MNRIHMELVQTIYDYGEYYWMIDGRPIVRYLNEAVSAGACPRLEVFGSLEGLLPAWTGELVWKAENRFIWELVDSSEDLNVPVLVCEDDCPEYRKWVSEHWDEELIRRRRNYTKPYMQREENITWICSPLWQFERKEYERMVEDYRKVYEDRMGRD